MNGMPERFQRRGGILQARFVLDLETDGLVAWIAFGIAQCMRAIVGAEVKIPAAALGDLQAEAGGRKAFRRFEIARTEPDVADILQLDHLVLLFLTFRPTRLARDEFRMNRHRALAYCLSMIFSENRSPLFRIML